jgi:hypothetical protein
MAAGGGRTVADLLVDGEFGDDVGAYGPAARPLIVQFGSVYQEAAREPDVLEGDPRRKGSH